MFLCTLMSPRPYQDCFNSALRFLARRDHSCQELSQKLTQRGFCNDHIQSTLRECHHFNYLDDEKYATIYVLQLQRRGYGPRRIRQMLISKGIAAELISATMQRRCTETQECEDCRDALEKKLRTMRNKNEVPTPKDRLFRFLINRGFSPAIIRRTMDELLH